METARPSRFNNRPDALIDAKEACARLKIKAATLYTYVSRGWIRRVEGATKRERLYLAEDVERVRTRAAARRGHEAVAAGALAFGDPVLDSAITQAGPDALRYRGRDAVVLAEGGASLEAAAALLWDAPEADWPAASARWRQGERELPYSWRMARLLPRLASADPARVLPAGGRDLDRARRLVATFAAGVGRASTPRGKKVRIAQRIAAQLERPEAAPAIEAALVLTADHELNVSTFAARVAASGGADLYACLGAALYAFTGPRHGGASARLHAWIERLGSRGQVRRGIRSSLDRGEPTPGFGHPLYPHGDPRAPPLLRWATELQPSPSPPLATLLRVVEIMDALGPHSPNLDAGLLALTYALDRPPETASELFCAGRTVGWIAHAFEQRRSPELLRPRARYVGR